MRQCWHHRDNWVERFGGQNYEKLRKRSLETGVPWKDPMFPDSESSLGLELRSQLPKRISWLRPSELCRNPRFAVDGVCRHDVKQGQLGSCWFLAACCVLTTSKIRWSTVVPNADDQEYQPGKAHPGIFRFRFWRFGRWTEVVVDDRLPCDEDGNLLFAKSATHCEFWIALLEKAYAKLHGSYANLDGGHITDALIDFTSGVSEDFYQEYLHTIWGNHDAMVDFFNTLKREIEDHSLLGCWTYPRDTDSMGIVNGHAYAITGVQKVRLNKRGSFRRMHRKNDYLIRLLNPWGEGEWTGRFSDNSPAWATVAKEDLEKLDLVVRDDGEFWIPFSDFLQYIDEACICKIMNQTEASFAKTWHESSFKSSFAEKHQYRLDIRTRYFEDREDVVIQLSQRDTRSIPEMKNKKIGLSIFQVELNRKHRIVNFDDHDVVGRSDFRFRKHIFLRVSLANGRYLIVPKTEDPDEPRDFLLRVYTEQKPKYGFLKEDLTRRKWTSFSRPPNSMSKITIKDAVGLGKNSKTYGTVQCGGKLVKTPMTSGSQNVAMMFYHRRRDPLKLTVWKKNVFRNKFVGQAEINPNQNGNQILELQDRQGRPVSAQVKVEVKTAKNLKAF